MITTFHGLHRVLATYVFHYSKNTRLVKGTHVSSAMVPLIDRKQLIKRCKGYLILKNNADMRISEYLGKNLINEIVDNG